jgi:hypothetical protein
MKIKNVKLDDLKAEEKYCLSFPLKPELYHDLREKLVGLPFIIVNGENEIIFGLDYYHFLKSTNVVYVDALQMEISEKEALILNYNLKEKLTGLNLYEKLVFIKRWAAPTPQDATLPVDKSKNSEIVCFFNESLQGINERIMPLAERSEIYQKTCLDINVNQELVEKLDLLLSTTFRRSLVEETICLKTGLKLCDFLPDDRETLLDLFAKIPFTNSFQLKLLEMAEEIIFRDKCSMKDIFEKLNIEQYIVTDMEKPQRQIIDALFKYRNPIYTESESKWEEEIKSLHLPENMKVTHYPFFEKKQLELTINIQDINELKRFIEKIKG